MTSCRFPRWRTSAILDLMGPIMACIKPLSRLAAEKFGHLPIIEFQICSCVPNFIKIEWSGREIHDDVPVRHVQFSKFTVNVTLAPLPCYSAFLFQTSLKSDNCRLSYGQTATFLNDDCHIKFKQNTQLSLTDHASAAHTIRQGHL